MINDHTLSLFHPLGPALVRPIYDGYTFANLPATLHFLLTGKRVGDVLPADCFGGTYPSPNKVVLIFIDSFGWQFWQRYWQRSRLMRRVVEQGTLTPISALFPSTTAASVTTLNLGTLPAEHAVYEWNMFVPAFGETIQSLAFSTLGDNAVSCTRKGFDAGDMVVGRETMHQRLAQHGVRSIQLGHRNYIRSPYNAIVSAGADVFGHTSWPEALVHLKEMLPGIDGKALINLYWGGLDFAAHIHGPGSPVHNAEALSFLATLDALLDDLRSPDTLVLFTADHGHVAAKGNTTLYVNERFPDIARSLSTSTTGQTIWPNGSPRDMFLHIRPDDRLQVVATLQRGLADIAEVMPMDDAIALGLFGPRPITTELRRRLGDCLVLPHPDHFVWWRERGLVDNPFRGHHGGLSLDEMATVIGVMDGF